MVSKYVAFEPLDSVGRKTKRWMVTSVDGLAGLGYIEWHSPWRKYCFFPVDRTLHDAQCLRDIANFCESETATHYRLAKERRRG